MCKNNQPLVEKTAFTWRVHTANLLQEIFNNEGAWALQKPITILRNILRELTGRAIELNDTELNSIMCRLTLYEESDPTSPDYDSKVVDRTIQNAVVYKTAPDIIKTIERFIVVDKERKELNNKIKAHFESRLQEAAKNKDKEEFNHLLLQIPECPFLNTAYRIEALHKL